jgi:hypothetical protein
MLLISLLGCRVDFCCCSRNAGADNALKCSDSIVDHRFNYGEFVGSKLRKHVVNKLAATKVAIDAAS